MGIESFFESAAEGLGNAFGSGNFWSGIAQAGVGLFGNLQQIDAREEELKYKQEQDKLQYLLQLEKLNLDKQALAQRGAGSGSLRNKNADLIEVLSRSTDQKLKALGQLTAGYLGAFRI